MSASVGTALGSPIPMENRGQCRGDVYLKREMRRLWSANSARSVSQPPTGGTGAPRREAPCAHALSFTPPIHPYPPWSIYCSRFSWRPRDPASVVVVYSITRVPSPLCPSSRHGETRGAPRDTLEASTIYIYCHAISLCVNKDSRAASDQRSSFFFKPCNFNWMIWIILKLNAELTKKFLNIFIYFYVGSEWQIRS